LVSKHFSKIFTRMLGPGFSKFPRISQDHQRFPGFPKMTRVSQDFPGSLGPGFDERK